MRRTAAHLVRTALVSGALLALATAADAAPRMTCSFVQKRCMTECMVKVGVGFCKLHCDGQKQGCLKTGKWDSFGRKSDNLVKR